MELDELEELEEDLKEANDDMKASIQKQIDKTKKKSLAMKEVVDKKISSLRNFNATITLY